MGKLANAFNKMSTDLDRSNRARRQMTADIAHELRTPLSLIIAQAEAVQDGILPANRKNFDVIHEEADRLENMVEDLRLLSLADAGELTINLQPVSVEKLLHEVAGMYPARLQKAKITLEEHISPNLPDLLIDPGRMIQVLTNIIDNALRHTPEKGRVTLEARQVENMVEISICDTGSGVKDENLERIFDRLYRVDSSRQRDDAGSGLGLAIAKSIVEMHQGKIWAEGRLGEGLTILIRVPIAG
jgi:signal transduction histidine kinase